MAKKTHLKVLGEIEEKDKGSKGKKLTYVVNVYCVSRCTTCFTKNAALGCCSHDLVSHMYVCIHVCMNAKV